MLPAAASEEKEELGTPQTPAGGLRPPALPALLLLHFIIHQRT